MDPSLHIIKGVLLVTKSLKRDNIKKFCKKLSSDIEPMPPQLELHISPNHPSVVIFYKLCLWMPEGHSCFNFLACPRAEI